MPARLLEGKPLAEAWKLRIAARAAELRARGTVPCLVAVTSVADAAWSVYVRNQAKACAAVGIAHRTVELAAGATQDDLNERIESLNVDPTVHGIIIQSPLRAPFNELQTQALLSPDKDVEAVGPANQGLVLAGRAQVAPCTAVAAVRLAEDACGDLRGVETVVVGAGVVVGRPIAQLLLAKGATVTTCHIDTRDLAGHTRRADLLIVAVGKAGLINATHLKPGAVVIDVGINRITGADGKAQVVGDVDPAAAAVAGVLTPVPGGVGALTTAVLLDATVRCAELLADETPPLAGDQLSRLLGGVDLPPAVADRIAELISRHLIHTPGSTTTLASALERRLARGVLVFDGGISTELEARGITHAAAVRANLDHPDLVLEVHRAYARAGAEVLTANTYGANRFRLGGDRELAARLSAAGVRLARTVAAADPRQPFVLASVGPLGPVVGAELPIATAEEAFAETALALRDAGCDGILVETMPSTVEAAAALAGIRRVCRLPVVVCRAIERDDARELADFARAMEHGGAAGIGINCAAGPRALQAVVARLAKQTKLPVIVRPNAGFPTRVDGRAVWHLRPEYFIENARAYIASGANGVGGCCGVGPLHIAALAAACAGAPLAPRAAAEVAVATVSSPRTVHPLLARAATGGFITCACVPARLTSGAAATALTRLAGLGIDAVGLLTGWPGAGGASRLPARLRHLQDATQRCALAEIVPAAQGLAAVQEHLLAAHLLDIRLLLVDGGVFAADTRSSSQVGCSADEVLALVARLNAGRDLAGSRLDEPTAFTVGVRVPAAAPQQVAGWLTQGIDFLTVQPVYAPARFRALMEAVQVPVPVLAEVLLLPDAATADELDNELPALSVPEKLKARLRINPDSDADGVLAFLAHWRERLAGVCLLLPDERTTAAERVLAGLRR